MKIDCKHWKKCHIVKGGCCALGKFGGAPSFGTCILVCKKYKGKQTLNDILLAMPSLTQQAENLAKAAVKVAKATAKGDQIFATKEIVSFRQEICNTCEFYDIKKKRCSQCGCITDYKLKTSTESCPIGKWNAIYKEGSLKAKLKNFINNLNSK